MARILITVLPASGHVNPLIAVAQALQEIGHEVIFATDESYRGQLERANLKLLALPYPTDYVAKTLKAFQAPASWLSQFQLKPPQAFFFDHLALITEAVIQIIRDGKPDVLLTDLNFYAGPIAADACNLPYASYCAIVNTLVSPDTPPYGLGSDWVPEGHPSRRLWPILSIAMYAVLWRHDRTINAVRRRYGLKSVRGGLLRHSPYLSLVPTTEAYEYPRRNVPRQIMYVGPVTSFKRGEVHDEFPWEWFEDKRPTLYVSMGTIVGGQNTLRVVIEQTKNTNWKVILAVGNRVNITQFTNIPESVLIRNFVPQLEILKHVDAVICHGGNNTVTEALMYGLPLIVIPYSADQPESAARVKASGAGIRLRPRQAQGKKTLSKAIEEILTNPSYRLAAQRIQASYAACNGPKTSANLIEKLIETQRPVLRAINKNPTILPDDLANI